MRIIQGSFRRGALALSVAALALVATGCATTDTRPDDMSAAAHRAKARELRDEAARHNAKYDPTAVRTRLTGGGGDGDIAAEWDEYNPTAWHKTQSERVGRHAHEHDAAAQSLEHFEAAECRDIPQDVRSSCPLMGPVTAAVDVDGGVRLELQPGVPMDLLVAHIRCHFAYGRTQGRAGMPHCPLYLKDLTVTRVGAHAIELKTPHADDLDALRERSRNHVAR